MSTCTTCGGTKRVELRYPRETHGGNAPITDKPCPVCCRVPSRVEELEEAIETAIRILQSPSPFDCARPLLRALGREDETEAVWRAAFGDTQRNRDEIVRLRERLALKVRTETVNITSRDEALYTLLKQCEDRVLAGRSAWAALHQISRSEPLREYLLRIAETMAVEKFESETGRPFRPASIFDSALFQVGREESLQFIWHLLDELERYMSPEYQQS